MATSYATKKGWPKAKPLTREGWLCLEDLMANAEYVSNVITSRLRKGGYMNTYHCTLSRDTWEDVLQATWLEMIERLSRRSLQVRLVTFILNVTNFTKNRIRPTQRRKSGHCWVGENFPKSIQSIADGLRRTWEGMPSDGGAFEPNVSDFLMDPTTAHNGKRNHSDHQVDWEKFEQVLSHKRYSVLYDYYNTTLTMAEIGENHGLSESRVSQLLASTYEQLRTVIC